MKVIKEVRDFFWAVMMTIAVLLIVITYTRKFNRINLDALIAIINTIAIISIFYFSSIETLKSIFIGMCFIFVVNLIILIRSLRRK